MSRVEDIEAALLQNTTLLGVATSVVMHLQGRSNAGAISAEQVTVLFNWFAELLRYRFNIQVGPVETCDFFSGLAGRLGLTITFQGEPLTPTFDGSDYVGPGAVIDLGSVADHQEPREDADP